MFEKALLASAVRRISNNFGYGVGMLGQPRYALALGTAALHLFGSLLLTVAGIKSATLLIAAYAR